MATEGDSEKKKARVTGLKAIPTDAGVIAMRRIIERLVRSEQAS